MTNWNILLETAKDGQTTAIVLEMPTFKVTANTRQLARDRIQQLLTQRLAKAEVVSLSIPTSHEENPWLKFGGVFKDDPDFADIANAIQAERVKESSLNGF